MHGSGKFHAADAEGGRLHELSGVCSGGWQVSVGVGQILEGAMPRSCQKGWRSVAKVVFFFRETLKGIGC